MLWIVGTWTHPVSGHKSVTFLPLLGLSWPHWRTSDPLVTCDKKRFPKQAEVPNELTSCPAGKIGSSAACTSRRRFSATHPPTTGKIGGSIEDRKINWRGKIDGQNRVFRRGKIWTTGLGLFHSEKSFELHDLEIKRKSL